MNETLVLSLQIVTGIASILALIVAWQALKINHDAQRNSMREKVFQWQFEALKEIFVSMNTFLNCYLDFEVDSKYPSDFNKVSRIDELDLLIDNFDIEIEKYEFILPSDIYIELSEIYKIYQSQVTNLYKDEPIKSYKELSKLPNKVLEMLTEMFGVEELTHENLNLIQKYAKKAKF